MEFIESISRGENPSDFYKEVKEIQTGTTKDEIIKGIIEGAEQTKEKYKYHGTSEETLSMACGSYLTSAIINLNLNALEDPKKDEKLHNDVANVVKIIKEIHSHSNCSWEEIKNGFFAEASVAVSLKIMGFEIYLPDPIDDTRGKTDLIAYDRKEKIILPIQVKSSSNLKGVVLDEITESNQKTILQHIVSNWDDKTQSMDSEKIGHAGEKLESLKTSLTESFGKMLEYLKPILSSKEYKVCPILIAIPGGDSCENSMFNTLTGAPIGKRQPYDEKNSLSGIIYGKLERIIYPEGEE